MTVLGFDAATLALIAFASLAAFFVRGLSGFGSAMVGIGILSIVLAPARVVPAFLALEVLTTVNLLPGVWRQIDWRSLRWVIAGCLVGTPLGQAVLAALPPDVMRLAVSLCLIGIASAMLSGAAQRLAPAATPGPRGALAAGAMSGLLNGAAAIGGPPAIVFYFATTGAAVSRATLIAYFLVIDLYALAWAGANGLLGAAAWPLVAVSLPWSLAGIALGSRLYRRLDEAQMRRVVWTLLVALGSVGTLAAGWRLWRQ